MRRRASRDIHRPSTPNETRQTQSELPVVLAAAAQRSTTGPYLAQAGRLSAKKQAPLVVPTRKLFPNTVTLTDPEGIVRPGFHPGSSHATKDVSSGHAYLHYSSGVREGGGQTCDWARLAEILRGICDDSWSLAKPPRLRRRILW
jgi:hypothetical protein